MPMTLQDIKDDLGPAFTGRGLDPKLVDTVLDSIDDANLSVTEKGTSTPIATVAELVPVVKSVQGRRNMRVVTITDGSDTFRFIEIRNEDGTVERFAPTAT